MSAKSGLMSGVAASALSAHAPVPEVVPSETVITTAGAGQWEVPEYNTLTITGFGAGGGGSGYGSNNLATQGANGTDTTIPSLSLVAGAGKAPYLTGFQTTLRLVQYGAAGVATGWATNTSGSPGQAGRAAGMTVPCGAGGAAAQPDGGAGGAAVAYSSSSYVNGKPGTPPGGGGSGADYRGNWCGGGGGGSRGSITYTRGDPGAPVPGDILDYTVGSGGLGGMGISSHTTGGGGNGADGQLTFTVA